ncbi:MAG: hypothetical protein CMF26_00055 [Kiloniella sp.]|nr:hypothetical protein [Kiloniella sp.]
MDLDQTDFSALLDREERAWSRFILNARPVLEAAVQRTFARQGLKPDAGLFQDAISASLERLANDDFALLRRFDPDRGSIRAFLAVVAGSTASNSLRAARRHSGADLSTIEESVASTAPVDGQRLADLVPEGLLSEREALVLRLVFERDLQGPDIARVLDISENTVRVLKARALKKLREAGLQPDGSFADEDTQPQRRVRPEQPEGDRP